MNTTLSLRFRGSFCSFSLGVLAGLLQYSSIFEDLVRAVSAVDGSLEPSRSRHVEKSARGKL